jgi:hypothetical protein
METVPTLIVVDTFLADAANESIGASLIGVVTGALL